MRIVDLAHRPLHELSGGQRQRTFIAQGLVQDADLLLLDEPVNGLDVPSREIITEVVREEADRGRSVVVSTHDIGAAASADLVALVATRLVAFGPPSDVLKPEPLLVAYGNQAWGSLWSGGLDPGAIGSEIVAELLPRSVPS
jgi:manganese transport system ATP-binding protein